MIKKLLFSAFLFLSLTAPAFAAIAHTQTFKATPDNTNSTSSIALTFASTPASGSLVTVGIAGYQNTGSPDTYTVDDNKGNSYSALTRKNSSDGHAGVQLFYAKNVTSSATFTVTIHFATAVSSVTAAISEWSGVDTVSPFDTQNTNGGTGTAVTTGSVTAANSGSLYVGVMSTTAGNVSITEALTKVAERENGGTGAVIAKEYTVSSGAINPAWTMGSSVSWAAVVAVFKPASTANGNFFSMM